MKQYFIIQYKRGPIEIWKEDTFEKADERYNSLSTIYGCGLINYEKNEGFSKMRVFGTISEEVDSSVDFGNLLIRHVTSKNRTREIYFVLQFRHGTLYHWTFEKYKEASLQYSSLSMLYGTAIVRVKNGLNIEILKTYGTKRITQCSNSMKKFGELILKMEIGKKRIYKVIDIYREMAKEFGRSILGDYVWDNERLRICDNVLYLAGDDFKHRKISETVLYTKIKEDSYVMILNVEDSVLKILKVSTKPQSIFRTDDKPGIEDLTITIESSLNKDGNILVEFDSKEDENEKV